jgi:hypothetical protein
MTRWPDEVGEGGWEYGMPCRGLRDVVDHWRDRFDWRAASTRAAQSRSVTLYAVLERNPRCTQQ